MSGLLRWALVGAALVLALSACGRRPANVFPETAAVEWETARNAGDADALAELHSENAQILPPGAPVIEGRAAIRTYYRNVFEQHAAPLVFDVRDIIVFGNIVYRQGNYSQALDDGSTEYGKFIQLWRKYDDGAWRIHRQMWSSNGPPLRN